MRQQFVQGSVEPIIVDTTNRYPEKIGQWAALIDGLCDPKFTGRFAQPAQHRCHYHTPPGNSFPAAGNELLELVGKSELLHKPQTYPPIAKLAVVFYNYFPRV